MGDGRLRVFDRGRWTEYQRLEFGDFWTEAEVKRLGRGLARFYLLAGTFLILTAAALGWIAGSEGWFGTDAAKATECEEPWGASSAQADADGPTITLGVSGGC